MSLGERLRGVVSEVGDRVRHRGDELRCQELVELVTDYLEGALDPALRARFEHHITRCPECTRYLDQARLTRDAMGKMHPPTPPPDARAALLDAFRNAQHD
jgi:anti-sigma factor RsiW